MRPELKALQCLEIEQWLAYVVLCKSRTTRCIPSVCLTICLIQACSLDATKSSHLVQCFPISRDKIEKSKMKATMNLRKRRRH